MKAVWSSALWRRTILILAASLLLCIEGRSADANTPINGVIRLFNGVDLQGFHTWLVDSQRGDPRNVFTVTNGSIRISGNGLGYLATAQNYRHYRLVAEFKWGGRNYSWGDRIGKARDSGIFLHSIGPDGNSHDGRGAFKSAIECNIFQGAMGDFLLIRGTNAQGNLIAPKLTAEVADQRDGDGWFTWRQGGRLQSIERWGRLNWHGKDPQWKDLLDFRGAGDVERPAGTWNQIECICRGDRITIHLNGVRVNEAFNVWPSSGQILLQCEGSEIFFRKVELHPLSVIEPDEAGSRQRQAR